MPPPITRGPAPWERRRNGALALYRTNLAFVDMMIATMMAKIPRAEAKISITKILTNNAPF